MAHIICSKRLRNPAELVEAVARLRPPQIHRFVVKHRNDEDEVMVTQVVATDADEVRHTMERLLSRTDFTVHALD